MTTSPARPLTVVVADENDVSRAGLKALLDDDPRFTVADETSRLGDVIALARRGYPDLIVLNPEIGGQLDVQIIADLAAAVPDTRICIRTSVFALCSFLDAMLAGAKLYVVKSDASAGLLREALALVGRFGADVIGSAVGAQIRAQHSGTLTVRMPDSRADLLTHREREVLGALGDGLTDDEVGNRFGISTSTVQSHLQHLYGKLGVKTRVQLGVFSERYGLVAG